MQVRMQMLPVRAFPVQVLPREMMALMALPPMLRPLGLRSSARMGSTKSY
jgi:hypothetical protein